jgi:hypothetical protein
MKTQQAGKDLACAVVVFKVWRLATVLIILSSVKWSIKSIFNPKSLILRENIIKI